MPSKSEKQKFVEDGKRELAQYPVVGVVQLNGIPDRLFQSSRNTLKPDSRFIVGKRTLLVRILESKEDTKGLTKELTGTSAIVLSKEDPFDLYRKFKGNTLKLGAKPKQVSPEDIVVQPGETSIAPGQAVTELKQAGIDVQIQKGKVVIAKEKVLVKKGAVISPAVAKALKTLEIQPFSAVIEPKVLLSGKLMFTSAILAIDSAQTTTDISRAFGQAMTLSMEAKIVNQYTVRNFVAQAYRAAMAVGIAGGIYDSGIVERLIENATLAARSIDGMVKAAAPAQ